MLLMQNLITQNRCRPPTSHTTYNFAFASVYDGMEQQRAKSSKPAHRYSLPMDKKHLTDHRVCRGREDEVPSLAIETLKQTSLRDCRKSASHADDAMIVVKVTGATSLLAAANYFDFHDT
jgi:hypothetical protein